MVAIGDADLVHAAREGDASALAALLERHRASLYATALSVLGDRAQAQDAVQDAFLVALARVGELREPAAASAWLRAVVRNACLMRLRARREVPVERPAREGADGPPPEEALEALALRDWVWTALDELSDEQRVVVMLRFFTRRASYAEIAALLGTPVGTVRSRLNQAKRRLAGGLLATAARAHQDHGGLTERRRREWAAMVDQIIGEGVAELYAEECTPDVLVEAPSERYRQRGIADHRRGVEESAAVGVRLRLVDVVASPNVTIVDGDFENPRHDPHHCPPAQTEVRFHPGGRTTRVVLYYPRSGG